MYLQQLSDTGTSKKFYDTFLGYNNNLKVNDGEWNSELNMSAHEYPLLATRKHRAAITEELTAPGGMITKDSIYYVDGTKIVVNGSEIEMELNDTVPKQLVSMGAYLLVWPDKKYLNTADTTDYGSMENSVTATGTVTVQLCKADGNLYENYSQGSTAPTDPSDGDLWMDTSGTTPALKQYSSNSSMWVSIATVYLKISAAGIGHGFSLYDGVTVSGFDTDDLNKTYVLYGAGDGYIIVTGIITSAITQEGGVTVKRSVPDMDYVTECDNRIWGCKYGFVDGTTVNEIYACKLGDFKNWNCFMGLSTDSYAASRGSDGQFTGAITYLGYPMFFKEHCLEKVYPSTSGAHQIVTTICNGVQKGSYRSMQIVGNTLYYKGITDVLAYGGSLPSSISDALGNVQYSDARAGNIDGVYYINMKDSNDEYHLFSYDTGNGIWHCEDDIKAMCFTAMDDKLYFLDENAKEIICMDSDEDEVFDWEVVSGIIGYDAAEEKYLSRFVFRADINGSIKLQIKYDNGQWEDKGFYQMPTIKSFILPVQPRRCDHLQFRLSGTGDAKIYSIARYYEKGSDVAW